MRDLSIYCLLLVCAAARLHAGAFEDKVLPLLTRNCLPCHDEKTHTSGLTVIESAQATAAAAAFIDMPISLVRIPLSNFSDA